MPTFALPAFKKSFWPVLSADRVEQMTRTYNDMDVLTQLLAEVHTLPHTLWLESSLCLAGLIRPAVCVCRPAGPRPGTGSSDRSVSAAEEPPASGTQRGPGGAAHTGPGPGTLHHTCWFFCLPLGAFKLQKCFF